MTQSITFSRMRTEVSDWHDAENPAPQRRSWQHPKDDDENKSEAETKRRSLAIARNGSGMKRNGRARKRAANMDQSLRCKTPVDKGCSSRSRVRDSGVVIGPIFDHVALHPGAWPRTNQRRTTTYTSSSRFLQAVRAGRIAAVQESAREAHGLSSRSSSDGG